MMTVYQIALRLAKYIGRTSLDPSDPSNDDNPFRTPLVPGDREDILSCINGALQELWEHLPSSMRQRRVLTMLRGPRTILLDVTNGSRTVTIYGFEPWMVGCSICIGGVWNEIEAEDRLKGEYVGETQSSVPAALYQDCLTLTGGVREVVGPVEIPKTRELIFAGSKADFLTYERGYYSNTDYGVIWGRLHQEPSLPAQPIAYFCDSEFTEDNQVAVRLRVLPLPDADYQIGYTVRVEAPAVTIEQLSASQDNGARLPIPESWDELVLLPMALKRFTAHPNFGGGNPLAAAEVDRQYRIAVSIVRRAFPNRGASRMNPVFR